jgi:hypothetical protein
MSAYDADENYTTRMAKFGALRFTMRFETTHSHYASPQNGLIYSVLRGKLSNLLPGAPRKMIESRSDSN